MRTVCLMVLLIPAGAFGGQPATPTVEALAGHLFSPDPVVRVTAAAAIVEQGPAALPGFDAFVNSVGAAGGSPGGRYPPVIKPEDLVQSVRLAVKVSERLRKQPQSEVGFWMDLEDALAIEPQPVRDAALRRALGHDGVVADVLARRAAGRQAAIEFCRKWTDNGGVVAPTPTPQVVASNKEQEAALAAAGPTAAPYLLWVLSRDPSGAFHVTTRGPRSGRDFVFAMHAVRLLRLRAAVPYLLRWINGPSAWAHGVAVQVLESLVSETFGPLAPLEEVQQRVLRWWAAHRSEYAESIAWFLRAKLNEVHQVLAAQVVGVASPGGDNIGFGPGVSYEGVEAEWLKRIVSEEIPLAFDGDPATRLKALVEAEKWADMKFPR